MHIIKCFEENRAMWCIVLYCYNNEDNEEAQLAIPKDERLSQQKPSSRQDIKTHSSCVDYQPYKQVIWNRCVGAGIRDNKYRSIQTFT